eukprot:TRINITY_DN80998_c0_g1_i1.p1 TRINITY_DN80998_c0_g1~~TRINITY_DN80998_c0_g1_i1.p1  ORF type:complete len:222 (-),score=11.61 TRINITY_DN80998_c0_g1_i1:881-1546(-)
MVSSRFVGVEMPAPVTPVDTTGPVEADAPLLAQTFCEQCADGDNVISGGTCNAGGTSCVCTFPQIFTGPLCRDVILPKDWDAFTAALPLDQQGPLDDPDNDNLPNIAEYYAAATARTASGRFRSLTEPQLDPFDADTDDDLLSDGFEWQHASSVDPWVADDYGADIDSDGLSNGQEQIHRSNPGSPDTDLDGVSDGDEVAQGALRPIPAMRGSDKMLSSFA